MLAICPHLKSAEKVVFTHVGLSVCLLGYLKNYLMDFYEYQKAKRAYKVKQLIGSRSDSRSTEDSLTWGKNQLASVFINCLDNAKQEIRAIPYKR